MGNELGLERENEHGSGKEGWRGRRRNGDYVRCNEEKGSTNAIENNAINSAPG